MARCAGLFVSEKDSRGKWHPEIRLSITLLWRRDWPWPQQVWGMNCHDPEQIQRRIVEYELIHYKCTSNTASPSCTVVFPPMLRVSPTRKGR